MTKIIPNQSSFNQLTAIINDLIYKKQYDVNDPRELKNLKLLKAREENIDFEIELAEIICGDNIIYPYRSSYYLTKFFQDLGYSYVHRNETRRFWVADVLKELTIQGISNVIEKGLFRRKEFDNQKFRNEKYKEHSTDDLVALSITEF